MKLTGRWFPQIVDRDSGNLYPIYIYITKIVVLVSEPVRGRSRVTELPCFLYIIVYSCIIYVYRAMCMNVCMYHRSETLQYFNKLYIYIHRSCDSNILSFADDTTLFMSHNDLNVLYRDANKHINDLYYWFCANKLALNASNTKYIILRSKYKKTSLEKLTLSINGTQLIRIGDDCEETSAKFQWYFTLMNISPGRNI